MSTERVFVFMKYNFGKTSHKGEILFLNKIVIEFERVNHNDWRGQIIEIWKELLSKCPSVPVLHWNGCLWPLQTLQWGIVCARKSAPGPRIELLLGEKAWPHSRTCALIAKLMSLQHMSILFNESSLQSTFPWSTPMSQRASAT